ncbi:MAE_28990/MAE_18760 family HEPN-like nuclease [Aeromonas veronii]|uniref:MAE_28990/MAE_18760 family HEPN-like nuclease n=1 Tax=Aeromonas veronii TaxID=654 RepID=UPI00226D3ABF|nr:MAE_28990/MAE_18760 family HEPN-like nuclease [Aeromonas veronii]MCX9131472.1 MAE_28990/MAE_18760 family HEPN-like nuclease [Aeromonas veronii]
MKTAYFQFNVGRVSLSTQMSFMNNMEPLLKEISSSLDMLRQNNIQSVVLYDEILEKYYKPDARKNRSQYLYNLTIISLYGLFEQFIESQIEIFAKKIAIVVKKYSLLPQKMQAVHSDLTLKYAQRNLEDRYIPQHDKIKNHNSLIISLYKTLESNHDDFSLFEKVYSSHTANFRYDLITSLFNNIGIERVIDKTLGIDSCKNHYINYFGLDDSAEHAEIANKLSEEILDLVQRRNRIAHGEIEDDLLSFDLLSDKCIFFDFLCKGISDITEQSMQYYLYKSEIIRDCAFDLKSPQQIFPQMCAFGFSIKGLEVDLHGKYIYEGQTVYLSSQTSELIEKHTIDSIYYNGASDSIFTTTKDFEFAIKLKNVTDVKPYKKMYFIFG